MTADFTALGDGRYRVSGQLGFETVPEVWRKSRAVLNDGAASVIDLGAVTQVDSAALALVIEWMRWARTHDRQLEVVNIPEALRALARISEVENLIESASPQS